MRSPAQKLPLNPCAGGLWTHLERIYFFEREVPADLDEAFVESYRTVPRHSRLKRPAGRLDDQFYRDVSWAYREAIEHGLNPGKTLAEDSGAPQGTVNRWIAKARDLGYLPRRPGRGRVAPRG
jgi:hypothetical protein